MGMFQWLATTARNLQRKTRKSRQKRASVFASEIRGVEKLDDRTLLSVNAVFNSGTLTVSLDAANDVAFLQMDGTNVDVGTSDGAQNVLANQSGVTSVVIHDAGSNSNQSVTFSTGTNAFPSDVTTTGIEIVNLSQRITGSALGNAGAVHVLNDSAAIQNAVDLADDGATVSIAAGTYAEDVILSRSVTLLGANAGIAGDAVRGMESTIDPNIEFGLEIRADNVTIDGFEFTGLTREAINVRPTNSGPGVSTRDNVHIINNYIHETLGPVNQVNGIVLGEKVGGGPDSTDAATVSNVTIADNFIDVSDDQTARGIVMTGHFATITYDSFDVLDNVILAQDRGLIASEVPTQYLANDVDIIGNRFEGLDSDGITIGNLNGGSRISNNTFIDSFGGAILNFREAGGDVVGNTFENQSDVGLYFFNDASFPQSSADATVTGNTFTNNFRQVGAPALAVDLLAIQTNNTFDGGVRVSGNRSLYSGIQDAIDAAFPGDTVTGVISSAVYNENVDVNQALTLAGNATVNGTIDVSEVGAAISAGLSPGIITSGDLTLVAGSTLNVEIDGDAGAGAVGGFDQYIVNGAVNIDGATFETVGSDINTATLNAPLVIIDNDGNADPVVGTFAGLADGDFVQINGQLFRIFYAGGDGNDVVISSASFPGDPGPIIDDSDVGYSEVGSWMRVNRNGHEGGFRLALAGSGESTSIWSFDLDAGQYRVSATWRRWTNRATDAPYTISDSSVALATVLVDQQQAPVGVSDAGSTFQELGIFDVVSGRLEVQLTNDANGIVVADAIRIEPIGVVVPAPEIQVTVDGAVVDDDTGIVNFGQIDQGATVSKTFTVQNIGTLDLTLTNSISVPAGYVLVAGFGTTTLLPGASTTFVIANDPNLPGQVGEVAFGNDDSDENPFNFQLQASSVQIIDNSTAGYSTTGSWSTINRNGHLAGFQYAQPDGGGNTARWTFNVANGDYSVAAVWRAHSNRAVDATYVIRDGVGGPILTTVSVDQRVKPNADFVEGPTLFDRFQSLSTVTVTGGQLVVELSDSATGLVIADAIRLEELS